jgi:hypothetical protein
MNVAGVMALGVGFCMAVCSAIIVGFLSVRSFKTLVTVRVGGCSYRAPDISFGAPLKTGKWSGISAAVSSRYARQRVGTYSVEPIGRQVGRLLRAIHGRISRSGERS